MSFLYDSIDLSDFGSCFVFFQAKDGIRDHCVTGVQTCALPIFIELNRRVGAAGGDTTFVTGSPVFIYWPGVAVFVGAAFGVAALGVRALQVGAFAAAGFIAAFLALFMWQAGNFFLRNRPAAYDPHAVPQRVLQIGRAHV